MITNCDKMASMPMNLKHFLNSLVGNPVMVKLKWGRKRKVAKLRECLPWLRLASPQQNRTFFAHACTEIG